MWKKIKNSINHTKMLIKDLPTIWTSLFVLCFVIMNFLASKEINWGNDWIAFDCGVVVSWFAFLYMDIITRQFDAKATIKVGIFALAVNLLVTLIFIFVSYIPGNWAQYYELENTIANEAINKTIRTTWYVLLGSSVAFLSSCILNAVLNQAIGKLFKKYHFLEFITRTYISTVISQFVDNLIFVFIVSYVFFGWNIRQCIFCAFAGCIIELLCEVIFSPFGFIVSEKWRKKDVGKNYKFSISKD